MLSTTQNAIKAILATDLTISDADRERIMDVILGKHGEPPRVYTPKEVAQLLGKSRRTVTAYAKRGLLTPIYSGASGERAQGYTGESVAALLSGKTSAKGSGMAA